MMKELAKGLLVIVAGLSVVATGFYTPAFADEVEEPRKVVTFIDEGTTVSQQIVTTGDCLYEPEALGKDGYVFTGWFDGDEEADFWTCNQTVSEDLETKFYTAKYVEAELRVNFMASEDRQGATVFSSEAVTNGETASEPTNKPTRAGYAITGWEDVNGNEFDFSTAITENIDLYPVFGPAQTAYKVFVYKENADDEGEYALVYDDELSGLTGSEISLSEDEIKAYLAGLKNGAYYELYKIDGDTTVKADGTSEVEVYFKRKEYTIVLNAYFGNIPLTIVADGNHNGTYTISGVKLGANVANWPSNVTMYGLSYDYYDGWKLDGGSLILGKTQTVYTAEMLGDGSADTLTYNLATQDVQWFWVPDNSFWGGHFERRDVNQPNQEQTSVENDTGIREEHNEAETDPVYVTVQVQYIDYDYAGVANIHTDEYKFVRGEGGLALVPGYTGEYPSDTDMFVGWSADGYGLPHQPHDTSAYYFFENGLIDLDELAVDLCDEEGDCLIKLYAAFDYEPADGWFQEIEEEAEEVEETEEETASEEENPYTVDNINTFVVIAVIAGLGFVASIYILAKKEA